MLISPTHNLVRPFAIAFSLRHYLAIEDASWHAQLQVARLGDDGFASPLLDLDTSSLQDGWYYRDDAADAADGTLQAWPSGGVATKKSKRTDDGRVALAIRRVDATAELAQFEHGENLLVRARQKPVGGAWGNWTAWTIRI